MLFRFQPTRRRSSAAASQPGAAHGDSGQSPPRQTGEPRRSMTVGILDGRTARANGAQAMWVWLVLARFGTGPGGCGCLMLRHSATRHAILPVWYPSQEILLGIPPRPYPQSPPSGSARRGDVAAVEACRAGDHHLRLCISIWRASAAVWPTETVARGVVDPIGKRQTIQPWRRSGPVCNGRALCRDISAKVPRARRPLVSNRGRSP